MLNTIVLLAARGGGGMGGGGLLLLIVAGVVVVAVVAIKKGQQSNATDSTPLQKEEGATIQKDIVIVPVEEPVKRKKREPKEKHTVIVENKHTQRIKYIDETPKKPGRKKKIE